MNIKVVTVTALIIGLVGCGRDTAPREAAPTTVMLQPARRGTVMVERTLPGTVQPVRTATLLAQVDGEVLALPKREGDPVRAGDVLVKIDPSRLEASLEEAAAQRDLARTELDEARRVLERDRSLFERRGLAEEALEQSQANVATLEARLRQAEGRLASVQAQLDDTEVRAPFDGYVLERWAELGDVVGVRTSLLSVASDDLIVAARVSELDVPSLQVGSQVGLAADAVRAASDCPGCKGMVSRVYPKIDPSTRNTTAEIVPDPACAARIRPGMFVRVTVVKERRDDVVTLPTEAVGIGPDGGTFVYVADGGVARHRAIRVGLEGPDRAEVLDGVRVDEQVVVRGQEKLKDGAPIKVAETKSKANKVSSPRGEGQDR